MTVDLILFKDTTRKYAIIFQYYEVPNALISTVNHRLLPGDNIR